ncbi:MAG: penicillin-binding protein 2 [Bradymonadia bacterium]
MSDVYLDSSAIGYRLRAQRLMAVVVLVFLVFVGRLVQLQVLEGDSLKRSSEENFIRTEVLSADRGALFDRHQRLLAGNKASFEVFVTPASVKKPAALLEGLREVLELDALDLDKLREKIVEPRGVWRYQPVRVMRDVDRSRVARVEALRAQFDGLSIEVRQQRDYPHGELGAHLLGYLGRPTAEEAAQDGRRMPADVMVGRFGLEQRYEDVLAGRHGFERFVVNARGGRASDQRALGAVDEIVREAPVPGNDVVLTVDVEVQALLVEALTRFESGAAVVLDPRDGSILGMVSKPSFDPNQWSGRLPPEAKQAIDDNPYKPMIDKSIRSYFPGSVYKIVTALAGLEEGIIQAGDEVESPGFYEFGNRIFHCHKRSGHGEINLAEALAASADVYFYKLGERLGIDTLSTYALRFGFGRRTGLLINGESAGLVPTRAFHDEETPGGYQFGLALSTAIGQGDVRTTPLQMALAYAAIANGGTVFAPRIVDRIQSADGKVVARYESQAVGKLGASAEHLRSIVEGLEMAVADTEIGTAVQSAIPGVRIAGKTGTAQVRDIDRARMTGDKVKDFRERDHAWFAAFAPVEAPRLVVVVFLEHGGTGGKDAAPVARKILEGYHARIEPVFSTTAMVEPRPTRARRNP